MVPSSITLLASYIDLPFNSSLILILSLTYACLLLSRHVLLLVVLYASTLIILFDKTSSKKEMTKIICLLPLGLGSILSYLITTHSFQARHLTAFTNYVNFAVYGNIGMMVATSTGDTFRGKCSRVTCIALFIWIVQQGYKQDWKTVLLHNEIFVFIAVSKSWIFAHAIYRFVLLTSPAFGSGRRHRLLELYSLAMTYFLSRTFRLPFEYCFGMADTLVVPANAAWSSLATTFNLLPRDQGKEELRLNHIGRTGDVVLGIVSLSVANFACVNVIGNLLG